MTGMLQTTALVVDESVNGRQEKEKKSALFLWPCIDLI